MIVGAHVVLSSKNPDADHAFFRDVFKLSSIAAGGGYVMSGAALQLSGGIDAVNPSGADFT